MKPGSLFSRHIIRAAIVASLHLGLMQHYNGIPSRQLDFNAHCFDACFSSMSAAMLVPESNYAV
jgi:hypothetical protein